jgi:hypothetical protein
VLFLSGDGGGSRTRRLAVVAVVVVALIGGVVLFVTRRGGGPEPRPSQPDAPFAPAEVRPEEVDGRLGLHVTEQELAIWRERAQSGPYVTKGDVSENSPGDWDRITENMELFVSDPSAGRWRGPIRNNPGGCVLNGESENGDPRLTPPIGPPETVRDAAFYTMVAQPADGPRILQAVREELLQQAAEPGTDFNDTARYCRDESGEGYNPAYPISNWMTKLLFAYDYARIADPQLFSEQDRAAIDTWFRGAAEWINPMVELRREGLFEINGDTYTCTPFGLEPTPDADILWAGGPQVGRIQMRYRNHIPRMARLPVMVGIMQGNQALIDPGRRYVMEALVLAYYPQGALGDFERWRGGSTTLDGWKYALEHAGGMVTIADHLARAGDDSLYEFQTTQGCPETAGATPSGDLTHGAPKSLWTLMRQLTSYVDERTGLRRYACESCSDIAYRIDSVDELSGVARISDLYVMMANLYYQDPYVSSINLRERPGTPPYPAEPESGQGLSESGESGVYPGMLFMFGQMEGWVDPYPGDPGFVPNTALAPATSDVPEERPLEPGGGLGAEENQRSNRGGRRS